MAHRDEQTEREAREETINMRRSFSWNRDFFTSDGFLDAEELSNMIEGGVDDDVDHELQKFEEIENLEAKLFQEIEASTKKSTETSGKKNSQAKPVKAKSTAPSSSSSPVKTESPAKSSLLCGGSGGKKVKSPARRSTSSKINISKGDSPSKTTVGITTKNKVVPVNTRLSRTPPGSQGSSGSSSSMFSVKQRPRSSSAPRRSSMNNEKPSPTNSTKYNEKTTVNKVGPVSTRMSRTPPTSPGSSSSTVSVNQRSKRSSSAPRRSSVNNEKPSTTNANEKTTINKVGSVSTRMSRTPPASPGSSGSSSSTFSVNQRSKRSSSAPRRSSISNEKPSEINARRNNEKTTMNKAGPVSVRMSRTPPSQGSSSTTMFSANQRAKSSSAPRRSSINNEKPSETINKVGPDSTRMSQTLLASPGSSSSTTFSANQRAKRSSSAPRRSSINNEKPSKTMNKVGPAPDSNRMSRTPPASPGSSSSTTFSVNQRSKRSSSAPRRSPVNNEKPLTTNARKNDEYKTAKNKMTPVSNTNNTGISKTLPSSPVSSPPTFSNNQRSKRSNSVPRRSSVNEKPLETKASRSDEWNISKPAVVLIPKTQSSISLKIKPPPVLSHPSLLSESSSSLSSSASASSTGKVNQKSTLKNHPTGQTPDRTGNHAAASRSETRSPNSSKTGRVLSPKTVAAVNTGLKPVSQKTNTTTTTSKPSKKQSSAKAKARSSSGVSRGAEDIILVSPEVMDIKGKLNALKMEISMQKKLSHDETGKGESSSIRQLNNQTKSRQRM